MIDVQGLHHIGLTVPDMPITAEPGEGGMILVAPGLRLPRARR